MKQEIIIAGFGGQGVLSMGKILAYSGLMEGKRLAGCLHTDLSNVAVRPRNRYLERRAYQLTRIE